MMDRTDEQIQFDIVDGAFLAGDRVCVAYQTWLCCGVHYVTEQLSARVRCPHCKKRAWLVNLTEPLIEGE